MPIVSCDIVSPHLLDTLATSDDEETRQLALKTLAHTSSIRARRQALLNKRDELSRDTLSSQGIVPDQLLHQVIDHPSADCESQQLAKKTLEVNAQLRDAVDSSSSAPSTTHSRLSRREVYDMGSQEQKHGTHDETYKLLPGKLVRAEGDSPIDDVCANQAYDNCAKVLDFYREVYQYDFLDARGPIISSVHFEKGYQNASWLGDPIQQMVYGDGGGKLYNFTACLDIIGHEMTHAVIEHTCKLEYQGESGALNEHLADVFGMLVTLWSDKKSASESDWLIGEGCLMPGVKGVALRNMKFPGTAYDDPKFGKDPQPASWAEMEAYKAANPSWASYDHGSVHAFSGIANRALVLTAEAFGGNAWEKAGGIWWRTMHRIPTNCDFAHFAEATVESAKELFGEADSKTVGSAWDEVGIVRSAPAAPQGAGT